MKRTKENPYKPKKKQPLCRREGCHRLSAKENDGYCRKCTMDRPITATTKQQIVIMDSEGFEAPWIAAMLGRNPETVHATLKEMYATGEYHSISNELLNCNGLYKLKLDRRRRAI